MNICILIPAHNEEKYIGDLVKDICARGLDVVVVDDGSIDQTQAKARESGAEVLVNNPRQGKGYSLKRGFSYVLEKGYDGVIAMDGDGQHDPDDLKLFIAAAEKLPQGIVNGSRMHDTGRMPLVRRVTNRLMSWLISQIGGQRITDTQCGYRYVGASVLRSLELISNDFEIETEVLLKACRAGFSIVSVPIKTIYRDEKSKIRPVEDTCRFIAYLIREIGPRRSSGHCSGESSCPKE